MEEIQFFMEDIQFPMEHETEVKQWIKETVEAYGFEVSEINYIFCSDEYLHKINVEYLNHDTYTDIITFDNSDIEKQVVSDIFVSIERIRENATSFGVSFNDELHRVIIHGILHLLGFKDKTDEEARKMRDLEAKHLGLRSFIQ